MIKHKYLGIDILLSSIIIIALLILCLFSSDSFFSNNCYLIVSLLSLITCLFQIFILTKKYKQKFLSASVLFFVLNHIFNFGNFYLKVFSKEKYYIYFSDWFQEDLPVKSLTGLFTLLLIQALFLGFQIFLYNDKKSDIEYKSFNYLNDNSKKHLIFTIGLIMFFISFPCQLFWDVNQILLSSSSGYVGGYSLTGLVDDLTALFVPSLICLMYSQKNKKSTSILIMLLYLGYSVIVMALSGARRAYTIGILSILIFYGGVIDNKKRHFIILKIFGLLIIGIVGINFLEIIRDNRHSAESIFEIISSDWSILFSDDFIWNMLGEFGITGIPAYYSLKIFPDIESFRYGLNLIMSIIYILPIGWMGFSYNFSTTLLNNRIHEMGVYTHTSLGGSIICELYIDFGWISILVAIICGYFLCKLIKPVCKPENGSYNFRELLSFCMVVQVLNLVRGSSTEFFRGAGYFLIIFFILFAILKPKKNQNFSRIKVDNLTYEKNR